MMSIKFEDGGPYSREFVESESAATHFDKKKVDRCPSDDLEQYQKKPKQNEKNTSKQAD
jgi:hypothetical protein|tara:strand:- start:316 stop:492 length:177 start_codon:yes stop_codon:yes gene_type:complete